MKALLSAALLASPLVQDESAYRHLAPESFTIALAERQGETWCSLSAERAPLDELVRALASRAGLALEGAEIVSSHAFATVELHNRPLRHAVACVLGSVGLRAEWRVGTLVVREGLAAGAGAEELREQAMSAYLAALRRFPAHSEADGALFSRGEIEEARGNAAAAAQNYASLVERFPESARVAAALERAGLALVSIGEWQEAALRFTDLLQVEAPLEAQVRARTQLARCMAKLGRDDLALNLLDALDAFLPAEAGSDVHLRALTRARALIGKRAFDAAARVLDEGETAPRSPEQAQEALELRALALEGLGDPGGASRAWLAFSRRASAPDRMVALRHAARLALDAGDELGVLLVCELAEQEGSASLATLEQQVRSSLELVPDEAAESSPLRRIERAERFLAAGLAAEARPLLDSLQDEEPGFDERVRTRYLLAYGRALSAESEVDLALELLRRGLERLSDREHRASLFLLAGEMLERHGRLGEAVEAYQGRL